MTDIQIKAKDLVNMTYQPLGYLSCGVNSDTMWEYAKQRTIEWIDILKKEIPKYKSISKGIVTDTYVYWDRVQKEVKQL